MKHKQRIARATEKHATLLYKTGKKTIEVTQDLSHKTNVILKDGLETKGIDKEIYMAVISLALQEYLEDVHDVESRHYHHQAKTDQMECSEIQQQQ